MSARRHPHPNRAAASSRSRSPGLLLESAVRVVLVFLITLLILAACARVDATSSTDTAPQSGNQHAATNDDSPTPIAHSRRQP